ncbi:hypothetical protein DM02DRAFT_96424 [Periconia macrospinosa]|uniref:Uncharacterized protein n=1 Tax=Periconia macrospinosa TaxID=97972 RepID=A0A2V1E7X2_9PLEO|nr:hypothetical protein DM02DRAFT_96424 [Periconia macrospinosa]
MAPKMFRKIFIEYALAITGGLLRFVLIFPLSTYSTGAQNHWRTIKDNALLQQNGPYDPAIAAGEKLAQTWGTFGFWWIVAGWVPAVLLPAPPSILFAALDGCITAFISSATHVQTSYAPHRVSDCQGSAAFELHRPLGANESFFEAAARLNATVTDPFSMCKSYTVEWQYGLSVSVIFSFVTVLKIVSWYTEMKEIFQEARAKNLPLGEALLTASVQACKFIPYIFMYGLLYGPFVLFFRCLPISVKSRVRFARRCGIKTGQGIRQKSAMQMEAVKKAIKSPEEKPQIIMSNETPETLAEFLGIYDMLILVCQDLHYVDIANLGLVSKSVREAVLPTDSRIYRTMHFKRYTCQRRDRKQCWVCRNQICTCRVVSKPVTSDKRSLSSISTTVALIAPLATFQTFNESVVLRSQVVKTPWILGVATANPSQTSQVFGSAAGTAPPIIRFTRATLHPSFALFAKTAMIVAMKSC